MSRRILATAAVALLAMPVLPAAAAAADPACPVVVTHRTNPLAAPENTLPGIASVPATGSGMVEVDVQWTKTGFPVLMHDAAVDRTTNGTGAVATMTQPQATQLLAQDYAPWKTDSRFSRTLVPYGYEFVKAAADNDLDLLLDVKAEPTQAGMASLVRYLDMFTYRPRVVVMASAARVVAMRAWQPALTYWVIEYNAADTIRRGESIRGLGATGYAVPLKDASAAAVAYWHAYGLAVAVWTTDTTTIDVAGSWRQAQAMGVDTLITNQPKAALTALGCRPSAPVTATPTPTQVPTTVAPTSPPTPTPTDGETDDPVT